MRSHRRSILASGHRRVSPVPVPRQRSAGLRADRVPLTHFATQTIPPPPLVDCFALHKLSTHLQTKLHLLSLSPFSLRFFFFDFPMPRRTKRPTPGVEDSDTSMVSLSLHDIPIPLSSPYDGRPDQRAFDIWEFRVTMYLKCAKLSDHEAICMFHLLVSGRALSCFMENFTPSRYPPPNEWSLEEVFKVLQKECFPPDHKITLHKELMSATQGNFSVSYFAADLRFRAKHFPYISEQCLATIFFVGVHKYIRVGLISDGMGQDGTDLETLEEHAKRYELTRRMLRDFR